MKSKMIVAWFGVFFISILPVILLFTLGPKDYSSWTHTIGQVTGLIGLTMFALSFVLATRAKWIEDLFDGLDKVYPVHAVIGATSFVLLLMHPIFLVLKYVPSNMKLAAKYLLPGGLISVDFGIISLLGMIVLLMITLYSSMKYHRWKLSHEFLGVCYILAIFHVILVRDTVARDYIFSGYYVYAILVSAIGILAFMYSLLRLKLHGKKYRIKSIRSAGIFHDILLEPMSKPMKFKAGQFIFVSFSNPTVSKESHPFSLACATGSKDLRVLVKSLGDYTGTLSNLRQSNTALLEGPYGRFHHNGFLDEIWIAGGIGITPFIGLAKDFQQSTQGSVDLYYTVKSASEFVCVDELKAVASSNKNFRLFLWVSDKSGHLTINDISKNSKLQNKEYYFCGPTALKLTIKRELDARGISDEHMHDERFAFK